MPKITLTAARVNANMTQTDAANSLGISTKTLQNWENGATEPRATEFLKLCELYKLSPDDIILPKIFS